MPQHFHLNDYTIFTGDLRETFPDWLSERSYAQVILLTDKNTHRHCMPVFLEKTGLPETIPVIEIPAGEQHKNLDTCGLIWQGMLDTRLDRKALVINLGGGVIGDMGGFCAATWKRGVDYVQVPTTLLAMTDAAIGGKLAIDFQGVKNTIGVFRNPAAVFVDPVFLQTLENRELRSGLAEVLKHALIGDPELWRLCTAAFQKHGGSIHGLGSPWYLEASIAVKARIVQEDPYEKGLRALLNYGHTIGHALESYFLETAEPLTHGEAVAIGMICETWLDAPEKAIGIADMIFRVFPHRIIPESAFPELWNLMLQDKKNAAGQIRMAIPGAVPYTIRILEPNQEETKRSLLFYNNLEVSN